jgi:multidrug efflux pump
MLFVMATILMIQLQSFQRLFLVFTVAPLALIGVVLALLPSRAPLGFVAILGVLALMACSTEVDPSADFFPSIGGFFSSSI